MQLTSAQLTALKTHLLANTNVITPTDGSTAPFAVNSALNGAATDPTIAGFIANLFYNQPAKLTDNQPFASINVWNPRTTISQLRSAINWAQDPREDLSPPTDAQITNAWLTWQSLVWDLSTVATTGTLPGIDLGDGGVRKGVLRVWGDVAGKNAANIGAVGCGQQVGRNIELVLSNAVTGSSAGTAFTNAHPIQKDFTGATVYGQTCTGTDIINAIIQG